jgi:hypothetical protein
MKSEKKLARKKAQKRVFKKKLAYGTIVIAVIALALFIYSSQKLNQTNDFSFKATIVDHLSKGGAVPWPNQTFIDNSTSILEAAGFTVSIYSEDLDVDFYRDLTTYGFGLIVFRVHSAIVDDTKLLGLFTSEPYNESKLLPDGPYWGDWQYNALVEAFYNESGPHYFGIPPAFVDYRMQGRFQNTIIILMGCDGLKYTDMSEAFVRKGAKVCIGWNGTVDARHTDIATYYLLQRLVTYKDNVSDAVAKTMQVIGPAPGYGSIFKYYPTSAGSYTTPAYAGFTLNIAEITVFLARETERISLI